MRESHKDMILLTNELSFDKHNLQNFCCMSYYGTILELASNVFDLGDADSKIGIPILARSIFEAYVDLHNLCDNPTYVNNLEVEYCTSWKNFLLEAKRTDNVYLSLISQAEDLTERIQEIGRKEKELVRKGHKVLSIKEKCSMAGLEAEYPTIYGTLSSHSHNGLRSLIDRHFSVQDEGFEIEYFPDRPLDEYESILGSTLKLMCRATELVHNNFSTASARSSVERMRHRIDAHKEAMDEA